MSSSWTIWPPTRSPASKRRSARSVPASSTLPPYSPDLNPIEQFIAKLKALLRKAAARTKETLWAAVAEALEQGTQAECRNFLANSGYDPT